LDGGSDVKVRVCVEGWVLTVQPRWLPSTSSVARKLISEMPWVEDVAVRKVYPGTIEVNLKERKAFGIWQHGSTICRSSKRAAAVIAPLRDNKFSELPLFVGRDAETTAAALRALFAVAGNQLPGRTHAGSR
jgi:cell division septal protein FtsQ